MIEKFDKNGFVSEGALQSLRSASAEMVKAKLPADAQGVIVSAGLLAALVAEIDARRELGEKLAAVLRAKGFQL